MKKKQFVTKLHKKNWNWKAQPQQFGKAIPNMLTISALCMGLTSIHFGIMGKWEAAVAAVVFAGILDIFDGKLARLLKSSTTFGAELDSLADFINFGVAPSLLVYLFSLSKWQGLGWAFCLFFSACSGLRLARFNVHRIENIASIPLFSIGVPAPAGALITLVPIMIGFHFNLLLPPGLFAFFIAMSSFLMISKIPTFVAKGIIISPQHMGIFFVGAIGLITFFITAPWESLIVVIGLYFFSIPVSAWLFWRWHRRLRKKID